MEPALPEGDPAPIVLGEPVECEFPRPPGPILPFEDLGEADGIAHIPTTPTWEGFGDDLRPLEVELRGGFAVADIDGDGTLDIVLSDGSGGPAIVFGDGDGTFTDGDAEGAGLPAQGGHISGVSAADADQDGDVDLFWLAEREDRFLRNLGDGTFEDASEEFGLGADIRWSVHASWGDVDADGDLDMWIATYGRGRADPDETVPPDRDFLFVQQSDGSFVDRAEWIPEALDGFGIGGGFVDADGDGLLDLFVVQDAPRGSEDPPGSFLLLGTGDPSAPLQHAPDSGLDGITAGHGAVFGDANGDGAVDVFVPRSGRSTLYLNDGAGSFSPTEGGMAAEQDTSHDVAWGGAVFDHDLDGRAELLAGYGHMPTYEVGAGPEGTENRARQPDILWTPEDGATFRNIAGNTGLGNAAMTRGLATADLDGNGFVDVVRSSLYEGLGVSLSTCNAAGWLRVELVDPAVPGPVRGARIEGWRYGEIQGTATVQAGGSPFGAAPANEVVLGVNEHEEVALVVRWPDGLVTVNEGVTTRRGVVVTKP